MTVGLVAPAVLPVATRAVVVKAIRDGIIAAGMAKAVESGLGYFGDKDESQIPSTPANELISDINFAPVINITPTQSNKFGLAAEVINEATGGNAALLNKLQGAVHAEYGDELNGAYPNQDENVARAMRESLKNTADEQSLGSAAKGALKRATRKNVDGYYVSIQYHEWKHNTKPNATGVSPIENLATIAGKSMSRLPTYGEFVDDEQMRKGLELVRRVRRLTSGNGFTALATLAGTNLQALRNSLYAQTGNSILLDQATSNSDYFNQ